MTGARDGTGRPPSSFSRLRSLAAIVVFDIAGPLAAYSLLRSNGFTTVAALALSGIFPAFGVALAYARNRRLDAIGALVLVGIAVGTGLGLAGGSSRLVLLEDSVPTAVFGAVCLGSLRSRRPLMFRFALQFYGPDTPSGRGFADRWRHAGFRHAFQVITLVWGLAYLAEAVVRVIIVETTSTGSALSISRVMPYAVAALLTAWMISYGRRARRRGERLAS